MIRVSTNADPIFIIMSQIGSEIVLFLKLDHFKIMAQTEILLQCAILTEVQE